MLPFTLTIGKLKPRKCHDSLKSIKTGRNKIRLQTVFLILETGVRMSFQLFSNEFTTD